MVEEKIANAENQLKVIKPNPDLLTKFLKTELHNEKGQAHFFDDFRKAIASCTRSIVTGTRQTF